MKNLLLLTVLPLCLILSTVKANANPDSLGVTKIDGKNFLIHKVEPSEGWFSIARHYGISYAELRMANKDTTDLLQPGMTVMVPLEKLKPSDPFYEKNYTQGQEEVIHKVKEGETLFSIAKRHSTSIDSLKKWNDLSDAGLKIGQRLVVGHKAMVEKSSKPDKAVSKATGGAAATKDVATAPVKTESKPVKDVVDTSKKIMPVLDTTQSSGDSTNLIKTASGIKTETKKSPTAISGKGRKEITETGIASWIRDDDINPNKYYALHRTAPIGTIIRVTNKMNSKYVFVKVVGTLPDTGDNNDLLIKISKASAEKLGVRDSRFQSELSYGITEKK